MSQENSQNDDLPCSDENYALNTENDAVKSFSELMYKDKGTAMLRAVQMMVQNYQQQQQIAFLNQTRKEMMEQMQEMKKDLHEESVIEAFINNMVAQIQMIRNLLQGKLELMNAHVRSNNTMRTQFRRELGSIRSGIEGLKKMTNDMEGNGKKLFEVLTSTKSRMVELKEVLNTLSGGNANLKDDVRKRGAELQDLKGKFAERLQKCQNSMLENETALKKMTEDLGTTDHKLDTLFDAYNKLLSEKNAEEQRIENMKQDYEIRRANLEKDFVAKEEELKGAFEQKQADYKQRANQLELCIKDLGLAKSKAEECAAVTEASLSEIDRDILEKETRRKELEAKLAKLQQRRDSPKEAEKDATVHTLSRSSRRQAPYPVEVAKRVTDSRKTKVSSPQTNNGPTVMEPVEKTPYNSGIYDVSFNFDNATPQSSSNMATNNE